MKIQHVIRTLTVFILVLVSFAATQPVFAASAGTHHLLIIDVSGVFTLAAEDPNNGCNIDITETWSGYKRINYWLDEFGWETKQIDIAGTIKINWSGPNGNVFNIQVAGPVLRHFEYLDDNKVLITFKDVGTWDMVTIPHLGRITGGGMNLIWVWTFDTTDPANWIPAGEPQTIREVGNWDPYNWEIICSYLGGAVK